MSVNENLNAGWGVNMKAKITIEKKQVITKRYVIEMETENPQSLTHTMMELANHDLIPEDKWTPVNLSKGEYELVESVEIKPWYVTTYRTERLYLGPEEGGRWGNHSDPVESVGFDDREEAETYAETARNGLGDQLDLYSVNTSHVMEVRVEDHPGREKHPAYEYE